MPGTFFARAKTLSIIDNLIADGRATMFGADTKVKSLDKNKKISFPRESIFELMRKAGMDADILEKIYLLFKKFDFENSPSVGDGIRWLGDSVVKTPYETLRAISLYDHSLRVATNAFMDQEMASEQRLHVALFGLLHDIGKSKEMKDFYGVEARGHEMASSELIGIILHDTKYRAIGDIFREELTLIDKSKNQKEEFRKFGFFGSALHRADVLAREQELEHLKEMEA